MASKSKVRKAVHTPGPWTSEARNQIVMVFGPSLGREVIDPFTGRSGVSGPELVCRVLAGPTTPTGVGEANARLITAAPDLLAACLAALDHIDPDTRDGDRAIDLVRAAIAKAEGV